MRKSIFILLLLLLFMASESTVYARKFITIGTGAVTGVYYPTGGAISRLINNKSDLYGIKATVESTAGSVYNINAVSGGDLEFGIAQSDRQYQTVKGEAEWSKTGPMKKIRSMFSIHPESITLIASAESGIASIKDLKGRRVNLGNPGSGQLQNSKDILSAFNISTDEIKAEYVKAVEAPELFQDEKIDAFFFTVGHPNGNIKEAVSGRIKVDIIPIKGPEIDMLIEKYPYYAKTVIPGEFYTGKSTKGDVESIGVKATLITSSDVDDDTVYAVTKEVFENLEEFKSLHPSYSVLTRENMLEGLSAPVHPGALKYYKETGLVKYIKPEIIK